MGAIKEAQVSRKASEALRGLAYSRAEFLKGCATSLSNMIGFGPVFRFTHFFHDSILNDNLKDPLVLTKGTRLSQALL